MLSVRSRDWLRGAALSACIGGLVQLAHPVLAGEKSAQVRMLVQSSPLAGFRHADATEV